MIIQTLIHLIKNHKKILNFFLFRRDCSFIFFSFFFFFFFFLHTSISQLLSKCLYFSIVLLLKLPAPAVGKQVELTGIQAQTVTLTPQGSTNAWEPLSRGFGMDTRAGLPPLEDASSSSFYILWKKTQ